MLGFAGSSAEAVDASAGAGAADAGSAEEAVGLRERKKLQTWQALHDGARQLLLEHGPDGVTVDEICARADVSPRTFFNYFPSKAAAALGLHDPRITEAALARFHARDGVDGLVDDLCVLMASTVHLSPDRARTKELVERRPELAPAVHRWMADLRTAAVTAATERAGADTGRLAVTLVTAALVEVMHDTPPASERELADRIRTHLRSMRELLER
jgi:AcrR family transcriptional regulator